MTVCACCLLFPGEHGAGNHTIQPHRIGLNLNYDKMRIGHSGMLCSRMLDEKRSVLF